MSQRDQRVHTVQSAGNVIHQTILVVEREEGPRAEMNRTLRAAGYEVIAAGHTVETQWCAERHGDRIALIVADLAPSESDAFHLGIPLGELIARRPVVFTGTAPHAELIRRGVLHPRTPFLRKPFAPSLLVRTVRRTLATWSVPPAA